MNALQRAARQALKWAAGLMALLMMLIALLAGAAALVDANHFRGPLIRLIAAGAGRPIQVQGRLVAQLWSLTPQLDAERVTIGNPPWMPPGALAQVGRLTLAIDLWPLFTHSLVIRRLELDSATLQLLRDANGRANWQWREPQHTGGGQGLPIIHSLSMTRTHLALDDAVRNLKFDGTVTAHDGVLAAPWQIEGAGRLNDRAATFALNGDALAAVGRERPYRFAFEARSSGSRLDARGSLRRPFDFRALELGFEAAGEDLKDLYFLIGLRLPDTGRYRLSGRLARDGSRFCYTDLQVNCGQSDLHGTVSIETSGVRPRAEADLNALSLRWSDLGARAAGRASPLPDAQQKLLSDTPLPLTGLRKSDVAVEFHAQSLQVGHVPLHAVAAHLTLEGGMLVISPLSAAPPEGRIAGRVKLDAMRELPAADLDVAIRNLRVGQFDRKHEAQPALDGLLQARLVLAGNGRSIHEIAANAHGTMTAVLPHGIMRAAFAELVGMDLARGLGLLFTKSRQETGVRCAIASFRAQDGVLQVQKLVIDTDPVLVNGEGEIRLDTEAIDLSLYGEPKSQRLLRLHSPILVRGTILHPSIGLQAGNAAARTGKALALGVVLAPLEVLGFVDEDLAKNADCTALLAEARKQGVETTTTPAH